MNALLPAGYLAAAALALVIPIFLIFYLKNRRKLNFSFFGLPMTGFICAQIISSLAGSALDYFASGWVAMLSSILAIAMVLAFIDAAAGEGLRFLILNRSKPHRKEPAAFGLGWGVLNSAMVGFLLLLTSLQLFALVSVGTDEYMAMLNESGIYSETELQQVQLDLDAWASSPAYLPILWAIEMMLFIVLQVSFTLIILRYFKEKKIQYLVFAFLLHILATTVNFYVQVYNYYLMLAAYAAISVTIFLVSLKVSGLDLAAFRKKFL